MDLRMEKNGWKKADGKAVQNIDLWERLYALTQTHEVTFHKVAGHADDELNNRCDELARAAITELKKQSVMAGSASGKTEAENVKQ